MDVVVSTLTKDEIAELELGLEAELCRSLGIDFVTYPIEDRGVPQSSHSLLLVIRDVEDKLKNGKGVAIHCRQGIGRASLVAACLLTATGMWVEQAFQRIATARGRAVPDTEEQRQWVAKFSHDYLATPAEAGR